jgi:hypothetical protein
VGVGFTPTLGELRAGSLRNPTVVAREHRTRTLHRRERRPALEVQGCSFRDVYSASGGRFAGRAVKELSRRERQRERYGKRSDPADGGHGDYLAGSGSGPANVERDDHVLNGFVDIDSCRLKHSKHVSNQVA